MAVYTYIAAGVGAAAGPVQGTILADSPRQARDQLRAQGLRIRELVEQEPGRRGRLSRYLTGRQRAHVTSLLQEMSTHWR